MRQPEDLHCTAFNAKMSGRAPVLSGEMQPSQAGTGRSLSTKAKGDVVIQPVTCPVCRQTVDDPSSCRTMPFCSDRCRRVDFFRWWDGRYVIVEELSPDAIIALEDSQAADDELYEE